MDHFGMILHTGNIDNYFLPIVRFIFPSLGYTFPCSSTIKCPI